MKTTETINGEKVVIDWEFDEALEDLDGPQWAGWSVVGEGDNGKSYTGNCQASLNHPEDLHDDVTDIEEIDD